MRAEYNRQHGEMMAHAASQPIPIGFEEGVRANKEAMAATHDIWLAANVRQSGDGGAGRACWQGRSCWQAVHPTIHPHPLLAPRQVVHMALLALEEELLQEQGAAEASAQEQLELSDRVAALEAQLAAAAAEAHGSGHAHDEDSD